MRSRGRLIQANVFQIGASVGLVIEFGTPDLKQAEELREQMLTVLDAFLKAKQLRPMSHDWEEVDHANVFEEILKDAIEQYLSSE